MIRTQWPVWRRVVVTPGTGQLYVKQAGVFVHKPTSVKAAGTFTAKTLKIKVGGVFQDVA